MDKYMVQVSNPKDKSEKWSFYFSTLKEAIGRFNDFAEKGYFCALFNFV